MFYTIFVADGVCSMQEEMVDPVIAADGHTYERMAIEIWLKGHDTSPMNGQQLAHKRLVPNVIVKNLIGMQ